MAAVGASVFLKPEFSACAAACRGCPHASPATLSWPPRYRHFSNRSGSHKSSLGLFVTDEVYTGRNGYSLRMHGLEPGVNDHAHARAIVMHGAAYVNPHAGRAQGRLGRSWGCPAVRREVARPMIDTLKDGQFVFAYYPDDDWLQQSPFLHCDATTNPSR